MCNCAWVGGWVSEWVKELGIEELTGGKVINWVSEWVNDREDTNVLVNTWVCERVRVSYKHLREWECEWVSTWESERMSKLMSEWVGEWMRQLVRVWVSAWVSKWECELVSEWASEFLCPLETCSKLNIKTLVPGKNINFNPRPHFLQIRDLTYT